MRVRTLYFQGIWLCNLNSELIFLIKLDNFWKILLTENKDTITKNGLYKVEETVAERRVDIEGKKF